VRAERSPADIVDDTLRTLVECLRARDLERVRTLFSDDAILFGSEAGETAQGVIGLREFFTQLFAQPQTFGWEWETPFATRHNDVVWFVAPASVELHDPDGQRHSLPYRLSGVLRERPPSQWTFEMFNGSQPSAG
jgi:ketosteroid isomerase-like protein